MRSNVLLIFIWLLIGFYSHAQLTQMLTEVKPLSISSESGKGSIYLKVSKSSNYILTFDVSSGSNFVYIVYDIFNKKYITDKIRKKDVKLKLNKDILYAVIYVTSEDVNIDFVLTDLDLPIISDSSLRAKISGINKKDKIFLLKDLPTFQLGSKLKRYILRTYNRSIYLAYQIEGNDDIKISSFIENIGWFDISSAVNDNITDIACFDFAINSKGELYVVFTTKNTSDFSSELIVKKFNSRKWIDISPKFRENIGFLVNISIDKRDNLYVAYLKKIGSEYKVDFVANKGYSNIWNSVMDSYVSKGNADVDDVSSIGIISEPFLGIFYNYKVNDYVNFEFIINSGKTWKNANIQSANVANSVKILSNFNFDQVVLSYITKDRPIVSVSTLQYDKWQNISPNIKVDGITSDILSYRNDLFLIFEDGNDIRLIYFDDNTWYFFNESEIFQKSVCNPQFAKYQDKGFILSYLSLDFKVLYFRLIS
ncbi:hypothetical protein BOFE_01520 [Candidatus Borrelia fainii]|uniref:Uncharacterized protein n=1 Tax=Candidatus Borrelia fainii TaxID=2518322 RepID=A0ABM8DJ42_9SPIR|nr:hypothetical protein [Candidatus Borrelia fainii]BDU62612.1 hypothetical protein BOFE_01520 [Candidatus Borrelia fainii]